MKKILIVDDRQEMRDLVDVTLSVSDIQVIQANNGLDACKMVQQEKPDMIIMDIMMPGEIDGIEATRRIRAMSEFSSIPIVMLTAKGQKWDIVKGKDAGANDYFIKPFSPLELIWSIR